MSIDLFAVARGAIESRSAWSYPLAGLFGLLSSVGPCAVTRYAAIASSSARSASPVRTVGAFVAGIVAVYAMLGLISSLLGAIETLSSYLCAAAAALYVAWGIRTAWRLDRQHSHEHELTTGVAARLVRGGESSTASIFVMGAASSLIISPCCAPVLGLTVAVAAAAHDPLWAASVLSVFALGHAAPLLAYGAGGAYIFRVGRANPALSHALAVVFAALLLGVGLSYAAQI